MPPRRRTSATSSPSRWSDVIGPDDPFPADKVGQPVEVSGTWVPAGTVYVSGREHDGQDGYWVVTPLAVGDVDAPALPIVRGWVADPDDGTGPPARTGGAWWRGCSPPRAPTRSTPTAADDILPQVRTADLIQHVDQDLYGAYGVAREPAGRPGAGDPGAAARRRDLHRPEEPPLRDRVVALRGLRRLHLVALGARRSRRRRPRGTPTRTWRPTRYRQGREPRSCSPACGAGHHRGRPARRADPDRRAAREYFDGSGM